MQLEERVGNRVPPRHPLTPWLLEHTALVLNACVRGPDGLTPWARARGRAMGLRVFEFGECVWWKQPAKGPQHDLQGNMGPRQHVGYFLGWNKTSNTYRILDESGSIQKARSAQARPVQDKWDAEVLKGITVTPWALRRTANAVKVDV